MKKEMTGLLTTLKQLKPTDIDLLYHLYLYRCLTIEQAKVFVYKDFEDDILSFQRKAVRRLLRNKVVEKVEYAPNEYVLFLTTMGVDIVRHEKEIPLEIFNPDTKIVKRGYYRSGELRMNTRLVKHQVFLNQFVLEFAQLAKERDVKWKYYDEKYVSQYFTIRPDGLIQLLDTDFFVEMDMGTESKNQLLEKWNHYRDFIRSSEFTNKERKILVLFVCENVKDVEKRKELIRFTAINQISDLFTADFDMMIGSKAELISLLFEQLIPSINQTNKRKALTLELFEKKHFMQVSFAAPLREALNSSDYEFYIRKVNDTNRILMENGRLQEYLLDDYTTRSLSVIHRIQYHNRNAHDFFLKFKRTIPYIVVANDMSSLFNDLKLADSIDADNVFYTTPKRLKLLSFPEALFQFDRQGGVFHFSDSGLKQRIFEKYLDDKDSL